MKKFFVTMAVFVSATMLSAQNVLPNDPAVRVGKLDNGLTYFIRHNDKPEQKCEFYLVSKAGAINQDKGQDGLAHFLEHMCFNGLKNLPGKQMLEYLQSIGAAFGANINAGTGIDQTSYMLNNIPVIREGIIDTCLIVMHDYSHFVLNQPAEIDAERGVILEEKRTHNTAQWRIAEQSQQYLYPGTKYADAYKDLIGSEETLKNFKPETLVDFYHTWYRPDKQAVIVVGDIDVDQIEAKLKTLFADIPAVENPREMADIVVPDNADPIVGIVTDPELNANSCEFFWRRPAIPTQFRNTDQAYVASIIDEVIETVMDERFADIATRPDAPFLNAGFGSSNLIKTCDAAIGSVSFKNEGDNAAIKAFLYEIEKAKRYGITQAEYERAKSKMVSAYEKQQEGAATRKNAEFIQPIMEYFLQNVPYMEPATECQVAKTILDQITPAIVNQVLQAYITDTNMSVILFGPSTVAHPTEQDIKDMLTASRSMEIEAPKEEASMEPLLNPDEVKAGKVKTSKASVSGSTEWTLSNGVKVVVLPTQHKKDEVLLSFDLPGGKSLIETADICSFEGNIFSTARALSGLGRFSKQELTKMLAGKMVRMSMFIGDENHGFSGSSTPKDIETALQLLYLNFTQPRFDADEYQVAENQLKAFLANAATNPQFVFYQHVSDATEPGERNSFISDEVLAKAKLATMERVVKQSLFKDAAGAVLYVVGNVDLDTLQPLVEKYVGSLPQGKKAAKYIDRGERPRMGAYEDRFELAMQAPKVSVLQSYVKEMPATVENRMGLTALSYILHMVYTDTLREEEGGTYGASVDKDFVRLPQPMASLVVMFDTNKQQAPALEKLARKGLEDIAKGNLSDEYFNRTVEFFKAQLPQQRITNSYWSKCLETYYRWGENYDADLEASIAKLSKAQIIETAKKFVESGNLVTVVMGPAEK